MIISATSSTRALATWIAALSEANGSSGGPCRVHHRCVSAITPSAVPTRVVTSCGVTWCLNQPNGACELESLGGAHLPGVIAVDRPVVMNPCVREQRRVESVIGMMVGEDDIGDVLRAYSPVPQGFQNRGGAGDEARVNDDLGIAVPEVGHSRRH